MSKRPSTYNCCPPSDELFNRQSLQFWADRFITHPNSRTRSAARNLGTFALYGNPTDIAAYHAEFDGFATGELKDPYLPICLEKPTPAHDVAECTFIAA